VPTIETNLSSIFPEYPATCCGDEGF